jgi:glycosyltransferase involved in cell wall biosynthesis
MDDHDFAEDFDKTALANLELNLRACDGVICSTEFIARRYRRFNPNTILCENGVDLARYAMPRPARPTVNIGWAGATGHRKGVMEWLDRVGGVMERHPNTCFVSIGMNYADYFKNAFPNRAVSIPWTMVDIYPAAMTMFDIALAPAGKGNFFRGKSDLRWVEAGALGIPTIADPMVYPHISPGHNGFWAETPQDAEELLELLISDADLRTRIGENARTYVRDNRDMRVAVGAWRDALGVVG